jgi:glutathione S-transferase
MITLYGFGPAFHLPDPSPYVLKTEVQLQMAGLDYAKVFCRPDSSPKGQNPWIDDDGERVADSTFIRAHIERKYGLDLDAGLDDAQRAIAWAAERMLENHLGWCMVHSRWVLKENFEKGPAHFFDGAPEAMRDQLRQDARRQVNANVRAVGIGRHTDDEITDLGEKSLAALSCMLGTKGYLMGERPSGVDATLFGMMAAILTPFFDSPLRGRAERYGNLVAYADRMMAQYFPGHDWTVVVREGEMEVA